MVTLRLYNVIYRWMFSNETKKELDSVLADKQTDQKHSRRQVPELG